MHHFVALERPDDGHSVHQLGQLGEQPLRNEQAVANLAHVEISLRPGVLLEVERVDVANRPGRLYHDRESRCAAGIGTACRARSLRPQPLANDAAEEAGGTEPQRVSARGDEGTDGLHAMPPYQ